MEPRTNITITLPSVGSVRNLLAVIQAEPAVVFFAVNAAVAIGTTWGLKLTSDETGALLVSTTAIISALTALLARPARVPVVKGAVVTVLTAMEAFHLHLSQTFIAGTAATLSIVLGLLFRQNLTPKGTKVPAEPATGEPQ